MLPLGIRATNFAQHLRGAGASQATTLNAARSQKNPYAVQPLSTARTLPVTALVIRRQNDRGIQPRVRAADSTAPG